MTYKTKVVVCADIQTKHSTQSEAPFRIFEC